jgi:hypothetical protein
MVLQRALATKFQIVAGSRHPICINGSFTNKQIQGLGAAAQTGLAGGGRKPFLKLGFSIDTRPLAG